MLQIHDEVCFSIYNDDDIYTLANRHYENEIESLSSYILGSLRYKEIKNLNRKDSRMRMSIEFENQLIAKFNDYKKWLVNKKEINTEA